MGRGRPQPMHHYVSASPYKARCGPAALPGALRCPDGSATSGRPGLALGGQARLWATGLPLGGLATSGQLGSALGGWA